MILIVNAALSLTLFAALFGFLAWAARTSYRDTLVLLDRPFREIVAQFYEPRRVRRLRRRRVTFAVARLRIRIVWADRR